MIRRKSVRSGLIIAVTVSIVTIVAIFYLTMDRETWGQISKISPEFFIIALLLATGRWMLSCVRAYLLIRMAGRKLRFWKTVKAVLGGGFAGSVTPFHAAGIPTEIYFFHRYGLPGPFATAVTTTGAAISILLFTLAMPVVLAATAARIDVSLSIRTLMVSASIIAFFFFLAVAYSMKEPTRVTAALREHAPPFLKSRPGFERGIDRFSRAVSEFSESLGAIFKSKKSLLALVVLLTLAFWSSSFFVAPVIVWGLGYPELFWKALLAQLVVTCLLPFVPIPGESGMAEAAFAGVFAVFVPRNLVGFITLSWRFFMFYAPLAVTGLFFVIALRDATASERREENIGVAGTEAGVADRECIP